MAQAAMLLAAFVALALIPAALAQPRIQLPCERITRVPGCIECKSAPTQQCFLCQKSLSPVWTATGKLIQCKATVVGLACKRASRDANCVRCDGMQPQWCTECKPGFFFDRNYRCVKGTCRQTSGNPLCAVNGCNADGTCSWCVNGLILVPSNAIWLNVAMGPTRCMGVAQLNAESRALTGRNAILPAGCAEVDTLFRCNRCRGGLSLTGGRCVPAASGNKCRPTLPFRQYCAQCNAAGDRCLACHGYRSPVNGVCRIACKLLFGIGCLQCTPSHCTRADLAFINGRR